LLRPRDLLNLADHLLDFAGDGFERVLSFVKRAFRRVPRAVFYGAFLCRLCEGLDRFSVIPVCLCTEIAPKRFTRTCLDAYRRPRSSRMIRIARTRLNPPVG